MKEINYCDLKEFIGEYGTEKFKPFAYYDKHLDCIRIRTKDCSVIEKRLSHIFTVLIEAHSDYEHYVGFTIKGVRHLLKELDLPLTGAVALANIIDGILKLYPDGFVKMVQEEFAETIKNEMVELGQAA